MSTPMFDGATHDPARDHSRLASQLADVKRAMSDGEWLTLRAIEIRTNHPQASISARIRDLRKAKFGGHVVERQYYAQGLWEYRLQMPKGQLSLGLM